MTFRKSPKRSGDWVAENRASQKWSKRELAGRVAWAFVQPLFRFSARPLWGWRRMLLRVFGAQIASNVHIFPTARISIPWNVRIGTSSAVGDRVILYALGPIQIGEQVTISQGAHLCAGSHDWRSKAMTLLKPPISIGDNVWICADAFVGPNVSVGQGAIVGARAVVSNDVAARLIVAGNPARQIGTTDK